jgi:hypothetical protein
VTLISVHNLGGGFYRTVWSEPVTPTNISDAETSLLLYSPSETAAVAVSWTALVAGATQTVNELNNDADCTFAIVTAPLTLATSATPAVPAAPLVAIT